MSLPTIKYPFLPEGKAYLYIAESNPFMLAAKQAAGGHGCRKHATGAVAVKDGNIVATGNNAGVHVTVCPRVYKGYGTGQGYRYCKEYCDQSGHAEVVLCRTAQEQNIDLTGTDVYLYGHWWCCENCWNHMLQAGIARVYLMEGSQKLFNDQEQDETDELEATFSLYVSGPLTHVKNPDIKPFYERIGELAESLGFLVHVPHKATDPEKNKDVEPQEVYRLDSSKVKAADLMVCYVGEPSLGVGLEIEMACRYKTLVILLSEEGTRISRLAKGAPCVIDDITFVDQEDALSKLKKAFQHFQTSGRKQNVSIKR